MPVGPPLQEEVVKLPARAYYYVQDDEEDRTTPNLLAQPVLLRWAYAASLNVEFREGTERGDHSHSPYFRAYWKHVGFRHDELRLDLMVMLGIGLFCAIASWVLLIRRDRR
jgi:hypothetical protein